MNEIVIPVRGAQLSGELELPSGATGLVLFAHGSGSSRHSPRNQFVAHFLHEKGLGTLLFDLLTQDEERPDNVTGEFRFNIPFLANRLVDATRWALNQASTKDFALDYFGSSTGAAAALVAAAEMPEVIAA